jgi:hypothetical protein
VDLRRFVDDLDELILIELFDESDTSSADTYGFTEGALPVVSTWE